MGRAEEFIQEHTNGCSNQLEWSMKTQDKEVSYFHPWLTPDQALKAVEIAREEMIEKFYDWLKSNTRYIHPRKGTEECITTLGKLKQAMKDE